MDVRSPPSPERVVADVCIVGAGPSGLALADALVHGGVSVAVLEAGLGPSGSSTRDTDEGEANDAYGELAGTRARGPGGTARIWNTLLEGRPHAKYAPLDDIVFEARSWVPHSGWPIGPATLESLWIRAEALCGLKREPRGREPDPRGYPLIAGEGSGLLTRVHQLGPASRFTDDLPRALGDSPATVLWGAAVTELVAERGGRAVREVRWRAADGRSGTVTAGDVVLAAGGIENARILLLARSSGLEGIPEGWLGRGFMEHPIDSTLELVTRSDALASPGGFYSQLGAGRSHGVVGRIILSPELLRAHRLPNASVRLREEAPVAEDSALASAARRLVPLAGLRRLARHGVGAASSVVSRVRGLRYRLLVDLEQAPSRENRVTLSSTPDAAGVPRARLHWRWSPEDEARRVESLRVIGLAMERAGVGRVRDARSGGLDPRAHHHMGTTRMHEDPGQGVVNAELRVHGVQNLHVVGSSVFPTGGVANPTLTAVALALGLAERLAAR